MSDPKRPIGSRDWNKNGKYDLFDKVTDRYVYDHVMHPEKFNKDGSPKKSSVNDKHTSNFNTTNSNTANGGDSIGTSIVIIVVGIILMFFLYLLRQ